MLATIVVPDWLAVIIGLLVFFLAIGIANLIRYRQPVTDPPRKT